MLKRISSTLALIVLPGVLSAQTIVTPSNMQGWAADPLHSPSTAAQITSTMPRSGTGSLELYTATSSDRSNLALFKDDGFGLLKDLTGVSIDYWNQLGAPASPAVRLYLFSGSTFWGTLGWYDTDPVVGTPGSTTTTAGAGTWVTSLASSDGWWLRATNSIGQFRNRDISCSNAGGSNSYNDRMQTISSWITACGASTLGELTIGGIAIGSGADFADNRVFADNLTLTFSNQQGVTNYGYNFETNTVPEPSTYALMAAGLVGLVAVRRRRARTA